MSAILAMAEEPEQDPPRLYSKDYIERDPPDRVPERQRDIHAELEAWARWCWEKIEPKSCDSMEGQFDPGEGGRRARSPVICLPENPRMRGIDRAVRFMRMHMPAHGEALRLFYVGESPAEQEARARQRGLSLRGQGAGVKTFRATRYRPCPWWAICRAVHIPNAAFSGFMVTARAAVLNLLRRQGV